MSDGAYCTIDIENLNENYIDICEKSCKEGARLKLEDKHGRGIEVEEGINAIKLNKQGDTNYTYLVTMYKV